MARPRRQGIDYFPLDVHVDDKFKFIEIKFGLEGFAIVVKLLQRIYSCGYWCEWGEDESLIFAHDNNISIELLNNVAEEAIKRDIFCTKMYAKYQILTSSGVQKRYKEIVKRRKDVEVIAEYLLIDGDFGVNVSIENDECAHDASINSSKCIHDVNIEDADSVHDAGKSTQSKVKESKVKESISIEVDTSKSEMQASRTPIEDIDYKKLIEYFNLTTQGMFGEVRYPISDNRRKGIRARIRGHGKEAFAEVIQKAINSNFLKGDNSRGFTATFDWLIKPSNFEKTLSGNYDNKNNENRGHDKKLEMLKRVAREAEEIYSK